MTVLTAAKPKVESRLAELRGEDPIARISLRQDLAATFLTPRKVRKAIVSGQLARTFAIGRTLERLEQHNEDKVELAIPIDGYGWYAESRSFVARFAASTGLQELFDEVPLIEELLGESRSSELKVNRPDQVPLFEYGRAGDYRDLSKEQRGEVSHIITEEFKIAKVGCLYLGGLVIGDPSQLRLAA